MSAFLHGYMYKQAFDWDTKQFANRRFEAGLLNKEPQGAMEESDREKHIADIQAFAEALRKRGYDVGYSQNWREEDFVPADQAAETLRQPGPVRPYTQYSVSRPDLGSLNHKKLNKILRRISDDTGIS